MQRTPPAASYDSEPELSMSGDRKSNNINCRLKRKREDELLSVDTMKVYMDEMKGLFSSNMLQQEAKFSSIEKSINEIISTNKTKEDKLASLDLTLKGIKEQNADILKSMEFMSNRYEEMRGKLDILEADQKSSSSCIKVLEDRIDGLERKARSGSIEMRNITQNQPEQKKDLQDIVKNVCTELNVTVMETEICDVFRLKSRSKNSMPNPIIVEFSTANKKEEILNSLKKYRKERKILTTENLKIAGPSMPIYISENLTPKMKRIYYLAREFARSHNYRYSWTSYGNVYLRKEEASAA
ncbi:Zinc finger DNA binding protein, partial [Operophtera brumata]